MIDGADALDGFIRALADDDAETLYDRAPCGYLSALPNGTIVKANATFLTLTGYTRDELVGRKRFAELLSVGGRIYHETHFAPMLSMQGTAREIAFELVCADGRRLPVLVNAVLERDAFNEPAVIRTAVFDASHRRHYEEELLLQTRRAEESEARATALARTLQQTLLPPSLPEIPGLQIGAQYRPAGLGHEVGGDFYDLFQIGDDDWYFVIGDVCGKGAEAAVITALARYTLRAAAFQNPSPAFALTLLNDALRRSGTDRFCTAAVLRLARRDERWTVSSCVAGHPLPLRVDNTGAVTPIGRAGTLLGVLDQVRLSEVEVELGSGECVLAYTDGVTEARTPSGEFYGERRVRDRVGAGGTAEQTVAQLLDDVLAFQNGTPRDDIAIIAVGLH